ncbi:phosphoribosylaminoimidazole synthetase [uncultured delta proteobacterium]|uniref:Phosphoribosylformylglycinamidine cyclo-ligase n=1 Tax=uncultured delta proteobacterium TaxID=34034 RepID=A0A212KCB5_9DELT|nr:phosphoribosylaminoimidazole synthetase [uncultured delta proteobacterium]
MPPKKSVTRAKAYTDSGVDINAGNELVTRIKTMVEKTRTQGVFSDIGGFGGLFRPDLAGMEDPVLVSSTDGVGTKLKLAFMYDKHDTIGVDLVAMSVNDVIVQGARPLFFLDYFATGKLDVSKAATVINGVAEGCRQAGCALLGGETAEMPEMYAPGEYDLAGFCVGIVDNARIVDGSSIKVGDVLIGLASSGLHSNGYSLARKVLEKSGLSGDDILPGTDRSVRDALLEPTIIYVDCVRSLLRDLRVKGMSHITGGGFYDNIPRVLPAQVGAKIDFGSWPMPPVFTWLASVGGLSWPEMLQIFNCGIGYVLVVDKGDVDEFMDRLKALEQPAWKIGTVERLKPGEEDRVTVIF